MCLIGTRSSHALLLPALILVSPTSLSRPLPYPSTVRTIARHVLYMIRDTDFYSSHVQIFHACLRIGLCIPLPPRETKHQTHLHYLDYHCWRASYGV